MSAPAAPERPPAGAAGAGAQDNNLLRVDTRADAAAVGASLALVAGGAMLLLAPPAVDVHLPAYVLLSIAVLALLQAMSTVTALGKMLMMGTAALVAVAGGAAVWLVQPGGFGSGPPVGAALTLLGAAGAVGAMELLRAEAAATYVELGRRGVALAQQPATHLAALKFFIPWALVGILVLVIAELGPEVAGKYAAIFIQYFFNPVGKEVAVACGIGTCPPVIPGPPLHPLQVGPFLVFIDGVTALFLAWNYRYVLRVPYLGHALRWVEQHGRKTVAKRAWIRRLAFFGVLFYAAGPFEGTGAIGGTIVGRTIGLDASRTWVAVTLGSVLRTTILILAVVAGLHFFDFLSGQGLEVQVAFAALGAAVVLGVVAYVIRRRRRHGTAVAQPAEGK